MIWLKIYFFLLFFSVGFVFFSSSLSFFIFFLVDNFTTVHQRDVYYTLEEDGESYTFQEEIRSQL